MTSLYNKVVGGLKKDSKKREEEQKIRIKSILGELREIIRRRGVTLAEMADMLIAMQSANNVQMMQSLNSAQDKIEELNKKITELQPNDQSESKQDSGQQDKE